MKYSLYKFNFVGEQLDKIYSFMHFFLLHLILYFTYIFQKINFLYPPLCINDTVQTTIPTFVAYNSRAGEREQFYTHDFLLDGVMDFCTLQNNIK